jgi:hypothetical protein
MKHRSRVFALLLIPFFLSPACGRRQAAPLGKEAYLGHWKVMQPQLGVYYMTLNPDGSGSSTRGGGEIGKWQFKQDHIELEWNPKNLTLYFNPGESAPKRNPTVEASDASTAEKVDQVSP